MEKNWERLEEIFKNHFENNLSLKSDFIKKILFVENDWALRKFWKILKKKNIKKFWKRLKILLIKFILWKDFETNKIFIGSFKKFLKDFNDTILIVKK